MKEIESQATVFTFNFAMVLCWKKFISFFLYYFSRRRSVRFPFIVCAYCNKYIFKLYNHSFSLHEYYNIELVYFDYYRTGINLRSQNLSNNSKMHHYQYKIFCAFCLDKMVQYLKQQLILRKEAMTVVNKSSHPSSSPFRTS